MARVWVISRTQDLHVFSVPIFLNFPLCHAKRSITFQVDNCFFVPPFLCFDSKANLRMLVGTFPAKTFQDCQTMNFVLLMKQYMWMRQNWRKKPLWFVILVGRSASQKVFCTSIVWRIKSLIFPANCVLKFARQKRI